MFPATVITAWIADRKLFPKFIAKKYHTSRHKGVIVQSEGMTDIEMEADREVSYERRKNSRFCFCYLIKVCSYKKCFE